jgi:hypothetical protein
VYDISINLGQGKKEKPINKNPKEEKYGRSYSNNIRKRWSR